MLNVTRISFAVICALGVTSAVAQTVQPRGAATQVRPPLQTAQAPAPAGGAATGASGATGAASAAGVATAGAVTFITLGVVAVAGASESSSSTVTHNP